MLIFFYCVTSCAFSYCEKYWYFYNKKKWCINSAQTYTIVGEKIFRIKIICIWLVFILLMSQRWKAPSRIRLEFKHCKTFNTLLLLPFTTIILYNHDGNDIWLWQRPQSIEWAGRSTSSWINNKTLLVLILLLLE